MKNFSKSSILTIIISLALGLVGPVIALAVTAPIDLGTAANFAVLAGSAMTDTSPFSVISTGNVGLYPAGGSSYIGLTTSAVITGIIYSRDGSGPTNATLNSSSLLLQAQNDLTAAYIAAASSTITATISPLDLGGQTFNSGVYNSGSTIAITGTTTLDAQGNADAVFIFQAGSAITTASASVVNLINGAQACNVFWQVGTDVTLGTGSFFQGNILALGSITDNGSSTVKGRLLSRTTGQVTTHSTKLSIPTCAAAVKKSTQHLAPIIVPVIGLIKVPSPLSLPSGPGKVTYNYAVSNVGKLQRLTDISVVDDKCSPVVYSSGDINNNKLLDIDEIWNYTCSSTLTSTTTNTAIATAHSTDGYYNTAIATAIATVVVGSPIQPPLINVVKVPSQLTPFPFGGGNVTYTYTVTNPGIVAMNSITVTDDKCPSVSYVSGDTNNNNLLDTNESWIYTCKQNIKVSTGNVATAKGNANGLTALAYAFANVLVAVPSLPKTGFGPEGITTPWITIVLAIAVVALSIWLSVVLKKGKNKIKI